MICAELPGTLRIFQPALNITQAKGFEDVPGKRFSVSKQLNADLRGSYLTAPHRIPAEKTIAVFIRKWKGQYARFQAGYHFSLSSIASDSRSLNLSLGLSSAFFVSDWIFCGELSSRRRSSYTPAITLGISSVLVS